MFEYNNISKQQPSQELHKGHRIYTKIEDIVKSKLFLIEVPSIFTHLRNIKHLPEDEQKYILSLLDSDSYDDIYRFVRTRATPETLIEIYELHYPFEIIHDKDLLELAVIFQLYTAYLQENLLKYKEYLQNNKTSKKDDIVLQQAEQKLITIREIAEVFQRKARILLNRDPSLKHLYPLLDTPSVSIANLLKTYETLIATDQK